MTVRRFLNLLVRILITLAICVVVRLLIHRIFNPEVADLIDGQATVMVCVGSYVIYKYRDQDRTDQEGPLSGQSSPEAETSSSGEVVGS